MWMTRVRPMTKGARAVSWTDDERGGWAARAGRRVSEPAPKGRPPKIRGAACRAGLSCAGALLIALAIASPAQAAPLGLSATVSGLYGNNWSGDVQIDPYGVGVGVSAGFVLPASIYVGGALRHFFGQDTGETLLSAPPIYLERTASLTELTGHVGYDLDLVAVALRPSLGVGYGLVSSELQRSAAGGQESSASTEGAFVLSPGVEARFPIGVVAGCVELRYEVLLDSESDASALVIGVGVGVDL